jgi:hypothetical protein
VLGGGKKRPVKEEKKTIEKIENMKEKGKGKEQVYDRKKVFYEEQKFAIIDTVIVIPV